MDLQIIAFYFYLLHIFPVVFGMRVAETRHNGATDNVFARKVQGPCFGLKFQTWQ